MQIYDEPNHLSKNSVAGCPGWRLKDLLPLAMPFPVHRYEIHCTRSLKITISQSNCRLHAHQVYFREFSNVDTRELEQALQSNEQTVRQLGNPRELAAAEKIVRLISTKDTLYNYVLAAGGVFEFRLRPFPPFAPNVHDVIPLHKEPDRFAMHLCVTPAGVVPEGGQACFYAESLLHQVLKSVTRGKALLWRCDLLQKTYPIKAGEHIIVSFNLWGFRKQVQRAVVITFEESGSNALTDHKEEQKSSKPSSRESYILSTAAILAFPHSLLAHKVAAFEDAADGVLECLVKKSCFEEFEVVYKIYQRCRVRPSKVAKHLDLVRAHGFVEDDYSLLLAEDLEHTDMECDRK